MELDYVKVRLRVWRCMRDLSTSIAIEKEFYVSSAASLGTAKHYLSSLKVHGMQRMR